MTAIFSVSTTPNNCEHEIHELADLIDDSSTDYWMEQQEKFLIHTVDPNTGVEDYKWYTEDETRYELCVSHWMPLPNPPKKGDKV